MSKLHSLMKTLPRPTKAAMDKGAPYRTPIKGARADVPFDQARFHAAAVWPNLVAIEWLERIVNERSIEDARQAFEELSKTRQAIVMNGYLIKNNGKHRLTFDGTMYRSGFVVKPVLKSPYEFPVTTFAAWAGEVAA